MDEGSLHLAEHGRVLVVAISAAPSVSIVERIDEALWHFGRRHREGIFVVFVRALPARARPKAPSRAVRERMVALVRRHRSVLRRVAYVLPQAGMASALVRAMMAPLLGALPFPIRLFASIEEAVAWLARDPRLDVSAHELRTALIEEQRALR